MANPVPQDGGQDSEEDHDDPFHPHVASSGSADRRMVDWSRSTQYLTGRTPLTYVTIAGDTLRSAEKGKNIAEKIMKKNWSPFTRSCAVSFSLIEYVVRLALQRLSKGRPLLRGGPTGGVESWGNEDRLDSPRDNPRTRCDGIPDSWYGRCPDDEFYGE